MKRIFIAVDISNETRQKVFNYITALRAEYPNIRVGWDQPEKIHLTLKFLGDIDEKQLLDLIEAVSETAKQISDFTIRISKTGAFPSIKNARILWLGAEDENGELQKLKEILETECERKGFPKEKRSFKAHLTIARLREPYKSIELVGKHLQNNFDAAEFTVDKIVIYQSTLQPTGSIYSVVAEKPM